MLKLYELPKAFEAIQAHLDAADDGEIPPELLTQIDALEAGWDDKVNAVCGIYRELLLTSHAAQAEADRIRAIAQTSERKAERLKAYLQFCMEQRGITRCNTGKFKAAVCNNSQPTVTCNIDLSMVPEDFKETKVIVTIDKKHVLAEYKLSGKVPDGFEIKQGTHLRIS